jgi:hypothetical protein
MWGDAVGGAGRYTRLMAKGHKTYLPPYVTLIMRLNSQHQGLKLSAHLYRGLLRLFWHLRGETITSKDEPKGMGMASVNVPGRQGVILQVPLMVMVGPCVQPSLGPPVCWETSAEIGLGMCHPSISHLSHSTSRSLPCQCARRKR